MAARICREAGAGSVTWTSVVLVAHDARRLEVVADRLPHSGGGGGGRGVEFAVDTTLVSALRGDENPRRQRQEGTKTSRVCRCGRQIDPFCHHHAACSRAGCLGRHWCAVGSAAGRLQRGSGEGDDERHAAGFGLLSSSRSRWEAFGSSG